MITEAIFDIFFVIVEYLCGMLPEISWNVDTSAWQFVRDILNMVCYLLPISTITAIVTLIIDIAIFRVIISLIRTVKGLIPFI